MMTLLAFFFIYSFIYVSIVFSSFSLHVVSFPRDLFPSVCVWWLLMTYLDAPRSNLTTDLPEKAPLRRTESVALEVPLTWS